MQRVTCKDRDELPLISMLLEYWAKVKFTWHGFLENIDLIRLLSNLHLDWNQLVFQRTVQPSHPKENQITDTSLKNK